MIRRVIILKKALVALGALAMLTVAVPVSASTHTATLPSNEATSSVAPWQEWVTHNIAGWSSSNPDSLTFNGYGTYNIYIIASDDGPDDPTNVRYHINGGAIQGDLKAGYNGPITIRGTSATIQYFNKTNVTKTFRVAYTKQ
ncbi:hypothetical protein [Brevibacillus sp. VP]|uniref:hypothetical protein n=1 Tax=unclassified Brevibacillus TaxID=2684853 RepID=UPI0011C0231E|nr:hypothetical protein [Brevibacillus sp. VP]